MDNNKKRFYPAVYSVIVAAVVLAFVVSVYNSGTEDKTEQAQIAEENTGAAAVARNDVKSYREQTTADFTQTEPTTKTVTGEMATAAEAPKKQASLNNADAQPSYTLFDDSKEMSWPVEGQILMDYSMDTAVYDKTLDQYRTNSSLCIGADADSEVTAAADGIVEAVSKDREHGNSVVMNHGNGWKTTYSQLRDDIDVMEGQVVCEGDAIGRVGTPSIYSEALGTHLEFSVSHNDGSVDPKTILKNEE